MRSKVVPPNISAASAKSRPRSSRVRSRFSGSKVIFIRQFVYPQKCRRSNYPGQAVAGDGGAFAEGVAQSAGCARILKAAKAHGLGGRAAHPQLCASRKRHRVSASATNTAHSQSDCQLAKLSLGTM